MLDIKALDHINIDVRNVKETVDFYQKLFGFETFEEGSSGDHPYAIIGKAATAYLCIYEVPELDISHNTVSHIGFNIQNFDQVEEFLSSHHIPIKLSHEYSRSRSIYLEDPNGYEIELSEKLGGDIHLDRAS